MLGVDLGLVVVEAGPLGEGLPAVEALVRPVTSMNSEINELTIVKYFALT